MKIELFIDTMVYLHFRKLEELPLAELVGAESISIVMPRVTLRELEKHKDMHGTRRVRDRARKLIHDIEHAISSETKLYGLFDIQFFGAHPSSVLEELELNSDWADDVLIASVVAFARSSGHGAVALVTQDAGVRLTSKLHGVPAFELSPEFAIPEKLDPIEKENRELKQSLAKAIDTRPDLKAVFLGSEAGANCLQHSLSPPTVINEEKLAIYMERIKREYPHREVADEDYLKRQISAALAYSDFISPKEWVKYNEELDEFYREQELYFRKIHDASNIQRLVLPIKLGISNSGRGPADDVDIAFHFPDGFELVSKGGLPKDPTEPSPPPRPMSPVERMAATNASLRDSLQPYRPIVPSFKPTSAFKIRKTNSYDVTDHSSRIKQGKTYELKNLFAIFDNFEAANSFNITYKVQPANHPEPFTGELHVVVEKVSEPES